MWKELKTGCLHRAAFLGLFQVNPQTLQHARTRDVTSCWRKHTCGVKNNNCSSRRKSRRTVGVIVASPPRDQQGQTAPWLYVTLTTAVRIQHEMYSLMLEMCKYSWWRSPLLGWIVFYLRSSGRVLVDTYLAVQLVSHPQSLFKGYFGFKGITVFLNLSLCFFCGHCVGYSYLLKLWIWSGKESHLTWLQHNPLELLGLSKTSFLSIMFIDSWSSRVTPGDTACTEVLQLSADAVQWI